MLSFCPECGCVLQIEDGAQCMQFSCPSCPFVCPITNKISSRIYPKLKDLDEVLGGPGAWESAQVTDERCPTCSFDRAYFMELQTRSVVIVGRIRVLGGIPIWAFVCWTFYLFVWTSQVVLFMFVWGLVLLGVFLTCKKLIKDRAGTNLHPRSSELAALAISSCFLFEILRLSVVFYEEYEDNYKNRCGWFPWLLGSCREDVGRFPLALFWLWRLNVVNVLTHFLGELIVTISYFWGRSMGVWIRSFFNELPFLLYLPCLLMSCTVIVLSFSALCGYELNIMNGILCIAPTSMYNKRRGAVVERRRETLPAPVESSVRVVREMYQKARNRFH